MSIKKFILGIPVVGKTLRLVKNKVSTPHKFEGSINYWESRYSSGGNSGAGSYTNLANFKAGIINEFVLNNHIQSVIEWGVGDGNQLGLSNYPKYIGMDISGTAIQMCRQKFEKDKSKSFFQYYPSAFFDNHGIFKAELSMSLDVIYHLIEDEIFERYMVQLFASSSKFIIIYSNNADNLSGTASHVKDRKFTDWIEKNIADWEFIQMIKNDYPYDVNNPESTSIADFYFYKRKN